MEWSTELSSARDAVVGMDRGHDEVPVEMLEKAWAERNLGTEIQLTISGCLGTCEMRNVVLLRTEGGRTWLGGLVKKNNIRRS